MNIILSISKSAVFKEVAQTTSYTGAKMDDDANVLRCNSDGALLLFVIFKFRRK